MVACVVGGGIVGMLTARELRCVGLSPLVLEAEAVGAASPVSAGILFCVRDWAHGGRWGMLAREGRADYPHLCAGKEDLLGYERRGLLMVGADASNMALRAGKCGDAFEVLSPGACQKRHPQLAAPREDAVFLPDIAQVDPKAFLQHWRWFLQAMGVQWETVRVTEICHDGTVVSGVSDGEREWPAEQVILAAGAWSSHVFPQTPTTIEPRRGQIVVWRGVDTTGLPVVMEGDHYLVARADGTLLAGATNEAVEFDAGTTPQAEAQLTAFARRWYPELPERPSEQWAGLRPCGPANGPLLGACPNIRGLYFNTGHYRHGIVCAPATARRVVHQLLVARNENPL